MKNSVRWQILIAAMLVGLSGLLYLIHYQIYRDAHHIFLYLLGDIAFLPLEVLLVTLIIHKLLDWRERNAKLSKLNMVIGAFFSEVGNGLLRQFGSWDEDMGRLRDELKISQEWTSKDFARIRARACAHHFNTECSNESLGELREFLLSKRPFLLSLLENPNLLEHEEFTDLLWAVFHLMEELEHRESLSTLPRADRLHLAGDIKRAYRHLLLEWIIYMKHLKNNYPYLFSLALRTNPFYEKTVVTQV